MFCGPRRQHGVNGSVNVFSRVNLNGSDKEIMLSLYERQKVNQYFRSSSVDVRKVYIIDSTRETRCP